MRSNGGDLPHLELGEIPEECPKGRGIQAEHGPTNSP
jgi:hypothetical protein